MCGFYLFQTKGNNWEYWNCVHQILALGPWCYSNQISNEIKLVIQKWQKHDCAGAVMLILQFTIIQHRNVTSENGKKQCSVWPSCSPTLSDINPTCKKQINTNAVLAPFLSIYHAWQAKGRTSWQDWYACRCRKKPQHLYLHWLASYWGGKESLHVCAAQNSQKSGKIVNSCILHIAHCYSAAKLASSRLQTKICLSSRHCSVSERTWKFRATGKLGLGVK